MKAPLAERTATFTASHVEEEGKFPFACTLPSSLPYKSIPSLSLAGKSAAVPGLAARDHLRKWIKKVTTEDGRRNSQVQSLNKRVKVW